MASALRILVLEDNPPDAELAVRALKTAGWRVEWRCVETEQTFRQALEAESWDLILADFSVPGFGAAAALEHLQHTNRDLPVIVVSGSIGEEMAVTLLRAGAYDFVMKGHLTRLASAVERALREAEQRREKQLAEQERGVLATRWRLLLAHALDGVVLQQAVR